MATVEELRALGLAMGSFGWGRHVGWTTDSVKAEKARQLGATTRQYVSADPKFSGWEVSCSPPIVVDDAA